MYNLFFWEDWVNPWTVGVSIVEVGHGHGFCLDLGPITLGIWISKNIIDWN